MHDFPPLLLPILCTHSVFYSLLVSVIQLIGLPVAAEEPCAPEIRMVEVHACTGELGEET